MANTQAFCSQAKVDFMNGVHNLGADVIKAALFETTAGSCDAASVSYTAEAVAGEVAGANYVAGGVIVPSATAPALDITTAHWTPSGSIVYTNVTLATPFNAVLIYNDTNVGKEAISVHTFGDQTVTAGTFTLTMPTNDGTTGLLRIA